MPRSRPQGEKRLNNGLAALLRTVRSIEADLGRKLDDQPTRLAARDPADSMYALAIGLEELRVISDELIRQNAELMLERDRYESLFTHSSRAYVFTDADGNIQEANADAGKMLGRTPQSMIRKCLWLFVREDERKSFLRRFAYLSAGIVEPEAWQVTVLRKEAGPLRVRLEASVVPDARGRTRRVFWALSAINDAAADGGEEDGA